MFVRLYIIIIIHSEAENDINGKQTKTCVVLTIEEEYKIIKNLESDKKMATKLARIHGK